MDQQQQGQEIRQQQQMQQQKAQESAPANSGTPQGGKMHSETGINSQSDNYIDVVFNLFEAHKLECCAFVIILIAISWMYFSDFNINDLFKKKES